ncbi:uncharacterized protein CCOS01_06788 [Colletotrichum costaricense]|uniref:Uncharacterized protein n=2 Tax=Colletotrichum acutatum species complex TaxID=2707335 RepID=A0AAI9YYS5_9PEZI|nr:uncharacterized protein CCOS01_06788 [Colletotrichum costaricense]XP_060387913.1 uncharacterized protein CTAM01_01410 [Colletotrichum tamarilloi]KAK1510837.1 hypothetical protein CTAM01_01410 [Colletotrichum tamarilloi]KAK1528954.1 hypothetical protein CCOS01_06788 [Colletotrichum costaricense]
MAAISLDVYSQTAHLALDHGKRTLRGLRAAVLHKGQCLSLYQIGMVLAGTNNSTRDPTMSLPLQVNQREKLLATGPFPSSPDDSTSARSWHPDFIPYQPKMPDSRSWFPNAALGNLEAPGRGGLAPFCCLNRQKKPIDPLRHVLVRRVIRQSI